MLEREMASAIFALPSLLPGTVEDYRVPHNAFEQLNESEKTKTYSLQSEQIYMCFFSNCFTGNKIYQFFNSNLFVSIFFSIVSKYIAALGL